ncbi:acetylornithine transaminase [Bacillus sp. 03113]|uniref:acetylornithine transaminase n=1 Tax=Bacillus sp. 03113 TaxID=2578211 RepID=UPI00114409B4|nr:acetylornithine transaminase [Bacillus sp. 03113]
MSHLFPTYSKWEIQPESAKGSYLWGTDGKKYLDFTSGIGVCNLGHCPDNVKEAIQDQLNKFWHVSNMFEIKAQEKAAALLTAGAEMDYVFFSNSGAEANEAAIKLARKATGKTKIITFKNSFHGRTFATMAATGQDKIKTGFGPMLETFVYVPYNDLEALKSALQDDVAAVMLEVIQGEGGIHVGDETFLKETEKLCKEYGALFMIDEIQTGIGRTGKPFAFQHFGLKPDVITSAKGLANGLPIGAVIGKESLKDVFGPGSHGSTFGGNPLAVAAAIPTLETIFDEKFLAEVNEKSAYLFTQLKQQLADIDMVIDIRGLGLMVGIEINASTPAILKKLREEGLIILNAGDKVIRLLPPLTASTAEIDAAVQLIKKGLYEYSVATV